MNDKNTNTKFCVVNTHLPFHCSNGHLKLGIIILTLKALQKLKQIYDFENVIMAGDYNIIPFSMLY